MKMIRKLTHETVDALVFEGNERTKELIKETTDLGLQFLERTRDNTLIVSLGPNIVTLFPGNWIVRFADGTYKAFDWRAEKDFLTPPVEE